MTRILSAFNLLKRVGFAVLFLGAFFEVSLADTTWVSGQVSGVWEMTGSPYIIDSAYVLASDSLIVNAGVEILIPDTGVALIVHGGCYLRGALADSVRIRVLTQNSHNLAGFRYMQAQRGTFEYVSYESMRSSSFIVASLEINDSRFRSIDLANPYLDLALSSTTSHVSNSEFDLKLRVSFGQQNFNTIRSYRDVEIGEAQVDISNLIMDSHPDDETVPLLFSFPQFGAPSIRITNSVLGDVYIYTPFVNTTPVEIVNSISHERVAVVDCRNAIIQSVKAKELRLDGAGIVTESVFEYADIEASFGLVTFSNNVVALSCPREDLIRLRGDNPVVFRNNILVGGQITRTVFRQDDAFPVVSPSFNLTHEIETPWLGVQPGDGNITGNPLFDLWTGMPRLQACSPAIDAGNPNEFDSDNTRKDIGAEFRDQRVDYPPTLNVPQVIETGWGDSLDIWLGACDEGPVALRFSIPDAWFTNERSLDNAAGAHLFEGNVPYGVESFNVSIWAMDETGQTTTGQMHVHVIPSMILSGRVRGTLNADFSPYSIVCPVVVEPGDSLVIEPGVEIVAENLPCDGKLTCKGALLADGTDGGNIRLNIPPGTLWDGIVLDTNSSAILRYVQINGSNIIANSPNRLQIVHSELSPEGYDFYCEGTIDSLLLQDVVARDLWIHSSRFIISQSQCRATMIYDHSTGLIDSSRLNQVDIRTGSNVTVNRCIINPIGESTGVGVTTQGEATDVSTQARITHNVVFGTDHSRSLMAFSKSREIDELSVTVLNNILIGTDGAAISIGFFGDSSQYDIRSNCVWDVAHLIDDGVSHFAWPTLFNITMTNANDDSTDIYGNMVLNPFLNFESFEVSPSSPCIDAGIDFGQEFLGNAPDIGISEDSPPIFLSESSGTFSNNVTVYPNPTNSSAIYDLPEGEKLAGDIKIYDVLGRLVETIEATSQARGIILFSSNKYASGRYMIVFRMTSSEALVPLILIK